MELQKDWNPVVADSKVVEREGGCNHVHQVAAGRPRGGGGPAYARRQGGIKGGGGAREGGGGPGLPCGPRARGLGRVW
jgi:hypothetical protein